MRELKNATLEEKIEKIGQEVKQVEDVVQEEED